MQAQDDEAVNLIGTLIEVNADFFTQRVLPALNRQMQTLSLKLTPVDGASLMPSSS